MPKFRKKPVVVDAIQFDGTVEGVGRIMDFTDRSVIRRVDELAGTDGFFVHTLEGDMAFGEGDWIIKGVAGEFYPCKPEIFEATYEPFLSVVVSAPK